MNKEDAVKTLYNIKKDVNKLQALMFEIKVKKGGLGADDILHILDLRVGMLLGIVVKMLIADAGISEEDFDKLDEAPDIIH
jgi:hypothetical protein